MDQETLKQAMAECGAWDISHQYRDAIDAVLTAFHTDVDLRVVAVPPAEAKNALFWSHLGWAHHWSNPTTCVLVADPAARITDQTRTYQLPLGFALFYQHAVAGYPYYHPAALSPYLLPDWLPCHPIGPNSARIRCGGEPFGSQWDGDYDVTFVVHTALERIRVFIATHLLISHGFAAGVTQRHRRNLHTRIGRGEDRADGHWLVCLGTLDAALFAVLLDRTGRLSHSALRSLVHTVRRNLSKHDAFMNVGNMTGIPFKTALRFDWAYERWAALQPDAFRYPWRTGDEVARLLAAASVIVSDDSPLREPTAPWRIDRPEDFI